MMALLGNIGRYLLARLQERSTVAGIVGVAMAAAGVALPAGVDSWIINGIVGVAGLIAMIAMVVPGGK